MEGGELIFEAKKSEGDYHSEMDSHNFEKWFDRILPKLEEHSIVVMDNAPYHSRRKEKIPTSANKKSEWQAWLTQKQIPFEASEIKAQLMEKIKKEKTEEEYHKIFSNHGELKILGEDWAFVDVKSLGDYYKKLSEIQSLKRIQLKKETTQGGLIAKLNR